METQMSGSTAVVTDCSMAVHNGSYYPYCADLSEFGKCREYIK